LGIVLASYQPCQLFKWGIVHLESGHSNREHCVYAGDLAELTLLQGPRYQDSMQVGMSGGWNSTFLPRWYFIRNPDRKAQDQMTDAEIRGGLDGLIIAKNIQAWNNMVNNRLKLSQVLEYYYSELGVLGDTKYRGCGRKDLYTEVASTSDLELQVTCHIPPYIMPFAMHRFGKCGL
jgi:hypothetical protein